jgi:glycolate oxidase
MREMSEKYGLGVANVFHAGDGNLHPLILYDANVPGELELAESLRRRHPAALRQGRRRA